MHGNKEGPISWPAVCPTTQSAITPINRSGKARRIRRNFQTISPSTLQHLLLMPWSTGQRRSGPQIRASSPPIALRRNQRLQAPSCTSYLHVYMYASHLKHPFMLSSHTTSHHCIVLCIIAIKNNLGNLSFYVFLPPHTAGRCPRKTTLLPKTVRQDATTAGMTWISFLQMWWVLKKWPSLPSNISIGDRQLWSPRVEWNVHSSLKNNAVLYNSVQNSIAEQ